MARYLTINSQFNPVTFDEMIKPALLYKEEYERQQDAIDTLAANNTLDQLKDSDVDRKAYRTYNDYKSALENVAGNLVSTGKLDMNAIRNLRREYQQNIAPYETRFKKRNELIAEQAKNYSPITMYSTDYSTVSLDDINSDSSYKTYKLDDIAKTAYTTLASEYQVNGKFGSDSDDLSKAMSSVDIDGLDEEQIERVRKAASAGVNAARKEYIDYLQKIKLQNIKEMQAQTQYLNALRRANSTGGYNSGGVRTNATNSTRPYILNDNGELTENPNYVPRNPNEFNADTAKSLKTISGPMGSVQIYTDKFGNFTPKIAVKIGSSYKEIASPDSFSIMNAYGMNVDDRTREASASNTGEAYGFGEEYLKETKLLTESDMPNLDGTAKRAIIKALPESIGKKVEKGDILIDDLIKFGLDVKLDTYEKGKKKEYVATTKFNNIPLDESE